MSRYHREHPEKGNQVEPPPSAYNEMRADAMRKGEMPRHVHAPQETCDECQGGGLREIVFKARGFGDYGSAVGVWGDNNEQGHRTFLPVDDAALYLFPDEVLSDKAASDEARRGAEALEANRKAASRQSRLAENAEELYRFAKESLPAVKAHAEMAQEQARRSDAGVVQGMAAQANSRYRWLESVLSKIDGTPEEGKKP